MGKQAILLTEQIIPPPPLLRAGLEALPGIIRAQGQRASRRFTEFFTASIRNRNTRMAYARGVKQFFDWCDDRRLELADIEAITYVIPPTEPEHHECFDTYQCGHSPYIKGKKSR